MLSLQQHKFTSLGCQRPLRQLKPRARLHQLGAVNRVIRLSQSNASSCPFLAATAGLPESAASPVAAGAADLQGPGGCWMVLPPGSQHNLPEPEGRWCFNPLLGEYGELEDKGAGSFLLERFKQFGPVFTWKLGNEKVTAVVDYTAVKSLLKQGESKIIKSWNPEAMYAMLGESARRNLEDMEQRKMTRVKMAPGFSREALRRYLGKLVDICHNQLDEWSAADTPIDLTTAKDLSFEFSTQLLVDFEIPPERKAELKANFDKLFRGMLAPPINLPGTRFAKGLAAKVQLESDVIKLIRQRHKQSAAASSVLDYNLEALRAVKQGEINDRELAESGIGLIIAGNDTSGLGMTALLAILPLFPEVLDKLRQEQQQIISSMGSELSLQVLDAMPYADAVVREVLRVAPPSAQVMRRALVDMEICGKFVRAGSILHLSTFMGQVLTDPRLRPDSLTHEDLEKLRENWGILNMESLVEDFVPERWLVPNPSLQQEGDASQPERQAQPDAGLTGPDGSLSKPSGLLTFSAGPHACLGMSLFMAEAKVLLALLSRGYVIESVKPEELDFHVSLVTLLRRGSVKVRKVDQQLPFSGPDKSSSSSSSAAVAQPAAVSS